MLELNKVMLVGRLTFDPDYRETPTGRPVAKLRLAVNRRRFDRESGGSSDETAFIDCDVWNKQAEFARNYLRKGSAVYVEGRLKQDQWQDRETGKNMSKIVVVAERVQFAESRAEAERNQGSMGSGGGYGNGGGYTAPPASGGGNAPQRAQENAPAYDYNDADGNTDDDLPF